ncbi:DUF4251 domain-containing protein [uncultured Winogradskyella sp.]|uniref:DUF4251 domain-containing protein n=1 Tax=uncultured Winogradskyella sp. TaxID=395353 RepID=UPI00261FCC6F|nr:DUF4251 domain-containing protein [uncultured Winogradskyella sp.]
MKRIILLALLFNLSATTYLSAQSKQAQKEQFQTTYNSKKSLVQTQVFSFVGEVVFDGNTREKLNEEDNTIVINKSEISGQVMALQSNNKSIDVNDGSIENYKAIFNDDDQKISIQFTVITKNVSSNFSIIVRPNGKAVLSAAQNGLENVTWIGELTAI